jgi:hypothetical protein
MNTRIQPRTFLVFLLNILVGWQLSTNFESAEAQPTANSTPQDTVYLSTSFRNHGQDGLRFIFSFDGYHWSNVPGHFLKPHVGESKLMRDPSLLRGPDGTFHLVWTTGWEGDLGFGYSSSQDLVHWSQQQFIPVMEHEPTTVNVWAPELFYDKDKERFIICWASTIPGRFPQNGEPRDNNQRMFHTTTKDFKTFTPTELFFDPGFNVKRYPAQEAHGAVFVYFGDALHPDPPPLGFPEQLSSPEWSSFLCTAFL